VGNSAPQLAADTAAATATLPNVVPLAQAGVASTSKSTRADTTGGATTATKPTTTKSANTPATDKLTTNAATEASAQAAAANVVVDTAVVLPPPPVAAPVSQAQSTPSADTTVASAASLAHAALSVADDSSDTVTLNVAVVSSQTHFAPVAHLSPVQQIAGAVIEALPGAAPGAQTATDSGSNSADTSAATSASTAANATTTTVQTAAGPVKTLSLQLEPPSLGTVTITLSLSDNGLDVQMAASQSSTMSLIDKEKSALSDQLRESGYSVAGVGVTLGPQDVSNVANNGSATQDQQGQSQSQSGSQAMSFGESSNGNGNSQGGSDNSPQQAFRQTADSALPVGSSGTSSGDLYI
jgi:flagellar hook-length control protein FliK